MAYRYTNYSKLQNLLPSVPFWQRTRLVFTQDQKQLCERIFSLPGKQCIDSVSWSGTLHLTCINAHMRQIFKGQTCHGQAMRRCTQGQWFVPGLACRKNFQFVEIQLLQRGPGQRHMEIGRASCRERV